MRLGTRRHRSGFTLIEMIGVLAAIAILVLVLIPKIFESINNARFTHAQIGYQTVKTAVMEHFGKFISLNSSNGVTIPLSANGILDNFDSILVTEGLLEKPFALKNIGGPNSIRVRDASSLTSDQIDPGPAGTDPFGYDLSGDGINDIIGAQYIVEAVLTNVSVADAQALNDRFDGPNENAQGNSGNNFKGRVVYHKPGTGQSSNGSVTVFIYITHR